MTNQRLLEIRNSAITSSRYIKKYGYIRRNNLIRVSPTEHKWLCDNRPNMARFTRAFRYDHNDYVQDVDRATQARPTIIREVWIGSRSSALLDSAAETEEAMGDDLPAGFKKSQEQQEDTAEVTEIVSMLYENRPAFEAWVEKAKILRFNELVTQKPRLKKHRALLMKCIEKVLMAELPQNKYGEIQYVMVEDEDTGELRPIRPGDVLSVPRGSNDDLDSLFLEEADDPREQNDFSADGSDHRYSDRYRANTDMEEEFLHDRTRIIPNTALPDGTRYQPDDMQIRRAAQERACNLILKEPKLENQILQLTDEIEDNLRRGLADVRFDHEGKLAAGYFVNRSEYFACVEQPFLNRKPKTQIPCTITLSSGRKVQGFKPAKAAPIPMDWKAVSVRSES